MQSAVQFLIKSIVLGLVISAILLVLVPELRSGNGFSALTRSQNGQADDRISFKDAINKAAPAVVNIYSMRTETTSALFRRRAAVERTSLGSGVIMSSNGYILTCLHVIQGADQIVVVLSNNGIDMEAELIGADPVTDLALLKVNSGNLPAIPQLEDPKTEVGDLVLAIGNPYNLGQTVTQGVVSATGRSDTSHLQVMGHRNFIQMDAALNEGNSGGALVDSNGNLVGINNAVFKIVDSSNRVKDVPGVFFAVPYKMAKKVMDSIITNGRVVRGYLGVQGRTTFGQNGFEIDEVAPRSPAALANLRPRDMVMKVDGVAIEEPTQLLNLVTESKPGTVLNFEVVRNDTVLEVPVTIVELPVS